MATQKRQASVLGSTLTSLTLISDLSSTEEETSEADDEDVECPQPAKNSGESGDPTDDETGKSKQTQEKEEKKSEKLTKPRVRMKTLTIDGQLVYFCILCDKVFTRRKDKLNHELAHSSESVLTCTECGKEYFHESSLAYHMRSHAGDQLHVCDLCPKMFAQGHHLKAHILSHSQPTEFSCKTCYQDFALGSDLSEHVRNKIKEEMTLHWCKMCKVYFCRNHSEVRHVNKNKLHAHRCTACNELFYSNKKLRLHMKKFAHKSANKPKALEPLASDEIIFSQNKGVTSYKGDNRNISKSTSPNTSLCSKNVAGSKRSLDDINDGKPFSKRRRLPSRCFMSEAIHSSSSLQDSASEVKTFTDFALKSPTKGRKGKPYCKKCNKSFKDISELGSHKLLVHGESPKHFLCEICNQRFLSQVECDTHKAQHRKNEMHTCPMCSLEFFHSADLTQHLKEHCGNFPYKCNQCGKSFRLKLQLVQHIRLHIPQPSLACDRCGLQCSCQKDLDEHSLQAHDEEDQFKCHLCSKVFPYRYKLQNHLRLHTNVRTFQCYVCHKGFATKHNLQRHLQIHLSQGPEVDLNDTIKVETEEETSIGNAAVEEGELDSQLKIGEKSDLQNAVSLTHRQSLKDLKESDQRRFRSNNAMLKLDIQKLRKDFSSDSEESASSALTRESENSDPFRFSSDGSNSFKFTMAKERRKLRKKRQLSRLALFNKLNALKTEQFHNQQMESVKSPASTADDDAEVIQDLMIEINGVKSQTDNEVTLFVDLKEVKSFPEIGVLSPGIADMTDKENRLPCHESTSQSLDCMSKVRGKIDDFPDGMGDLSVVKDDGQTIVVDIEIDNDLVGKFYSQEEEEETEIFENVCSKSPGLNVADVKGKPSKGDKLSKRREDLPPGPSTFLPGKHSGSTPLVGSPTKSGVSRCSSSLTAEDVKLSSQSGVNSMQPLQSLHFMTTQIQNQSEGDQSSNSCLALEIRAKDDRKKSKSNLNPTSKQPVTNVNAQVISPHSNANVVTVTSQSNFHPMKGSVSEVPTRETCRREGLANKGISITNRSTHAHSCHEGSNITAMQSKTVDVNPSLSQPLACSTPFVIKTHNRNLPPHSGNSHKELPFVGAMGVQPASSSTIKSTSSFHHFEHQTQSLSFPQSSSLSRHVELGQNSYASVGPSKSHSSTSTAVSNHFSASAFYSESKPALSQSSPLCPKPILINNSYNPRPSFFNDPSNGSQIFDTKDPTLRNINLMELVGQNQGGISFAPTTVMTGPPLNVNTLQNNQNLNTAGAFFRPANPSSILPPLLGSLSSNFLPNISALPSMSSNFSDTNLSSDIPRHYAGESSYLPLLNNLGTLPSSLGPIDPPMPANLDFNLANIPSFGPVTNFCNVNGVNLGMAGPSLPLPVGLDCTGMSLVGNVHPNPMPFVNMDVMANAPNSNALRPMNAFNSLNLLPFGTPGGMSTSFNPLQNGIRPFNLNSEFTNVHTPAGTFLPAGVGFGVMPLASSDLLANPSIPISANPAIPIGAVHFPLGMPLVPESGIFPMRQGPYPT